MLGSVPGAVVNEPSCVQMTTFFYFSGEIVKKAKQRGQGMGATAVTWVCAVLLGIAAGLLIGCIGVGGVILVPVLIELPGISIKTAVASSMASYIAAGIVGTVSYARKSSIRFTPLGWFGLGAAPFAFLGSFVLHSASDEALRYCAYGLMLASAAFALWRAWLDARAEGRASGVDKATVEVKEEETGRVVGSGRADNASVIRVHGQHSLFGEPLVFRLLVGAIVGFGSAVTGTSGPVIMLPILFLAGSPPLPALGVAQGIQIPVATAATVGNLVFSGSSVNPYLALILTGALVVSVPVGAVVAHHVPKKTLKSIVTVALLVAAVALVVRTAVAA